MIRYQGKARNKEERPQRVKLYVGEAQNHTGERRVGYLQRRALLFGICSMLYLSVR